MLFVSVRKPATGGRDLRLRRCFWLKSRQMWPTVSYVWTDFLQVDFCCLFSSMNTGEGQLSFFFFDKSRRTTSEVEVGLSDCWLPSAQCKSFSSLQFILQNLPTKNVSFCCCTDSYIWLSLCRMIYAQVLTHLSLFPYLSTKCGVFPPSWP